MTYPHKLVQNILFFQIEGDFYFCPAHLLHHLFSDPKVREDACKAFRTRIKPAHRLQNPHNPNSVKLYRLDDLPQVIDDPDHKQVIDRFLQEEYPQLPDQVRQAFIQAGTPPPESSPESKLQYFLSDEFQKQNKVIERLLQKVSRRLEEAIEEMQQTAKKRHK